MSVLALPAAAAAASPQDQPAAIGRVEIPLREGRIELRDLVERLFQSADVTPPPWVAELRWSIDATSTASWLKLEALRKATDGAFDVQYDQERLVLTIDRDRLRAAGTLLEQQVYRWTADLARKPAPSSEPVFGVTFVTDDNQRSALRDLPAAPPRAVLLVHGLDDAGWRFNDLVPALRGAGHVVARFEYPNDGPIADAADSLAVELSVLRAAGVARLDLVTHSMGALVARDVLTRATYYAGDGSGGGGVRYPSVERLIMVAAPNHGSQAARLHGLAEFAEHMNRAARGHDDWLDFDRDGSGEAGVDLLPGSVFLSRLNARPLPAHVQITIIAGRISPIGGADVERLARLVQRLSGAEHAERVPEVLGAAVRGLGDGLVTIDSARLDGVDDFVIVGADHQSMIVNTFSGDTVPPAIPIILDRLAEPDPSRPAEPPASP